MPSLKLSNPFRRGADRPSLRERAAALRETAGRVMRRPEAASSAKAVVDTDQPRPIDWHRPPVGYVAHPAIEPYGFLRIAEALPLEAARLHSLAKVEFERRREAYRPAVPGPTEADWTADLRRLLRLDAWAAVASPERAEPAGNNISEPGFVLFEDAAGMTQRKPVADWIAYMAARLYRVARHEGARAFNAACASEPDQDANALYDRIRRDLRIDALFDLACRSGEAFEASRGCAVGARRQHGRGDTLAVAGDAPVGSAATASNIAPTTAPVHDLSACTLPQLARLYETWEGVFRHLAGANEAPCFLDSGRDYNPAGEVLDQEYDRAAGFLSVIADEAAKRTPTSADDRSERLSVLVRHEINTNGRPAGAALLSELNAAIEA